MLNLFQCRHWIDNSEDTRISQVSLSQWHFLWSLLDSKHTHAFLVIPVFICLVGATFMSKFMAILCSALLIKLTVTSQICHPTPRKSYWTPIKFILLPAPLALRVSRLRSLLVNARHLLFEAIVITRAFY